MVLLDTETPGTSREIYSEDAEGEARTRNPWIKLNSFPAIAFEMYSSMARALGCEFEPHLRHPHCKFLYWYQEFLCPVEPLYFSDEKSITVEK